MESFLLRTIAVTGCALTLLASPAAPDELKVGPDTTVETLLGKHGREQLARQLEKRVYGGKSYEWKQYSDWGRDLLLKGYVDKPPLGSGPSQRLSDNYRCVHCHNTVREDAKLTAQDPEARETLLRAAGHGAAEKRDGSVPSLLPGTTFWGAVNRTRFYNGFYEKYTGLKVSDGSRMNPERLQDALQICSRFCSVGRYPEPWELDSFLAYLWDLELKLKDLDLTPEATQKVTTAFGGGNAAAVEEARALVRDAYLKVSKADVAELPKELKPGADVYPGGRVEKGDAARGEVVFKASCGGCHGQDVPAPEVQKIARRARLDSSFCRAPRKGTERRGALYMPLFTSQRLSARQLADVRAYLAGRGGG